VKYIILTLLIAGALFMVTGCLSRGIQDHPVHPAAQTGGVDHGEYPGDPNHGDTQQR